MVKAKLNKKPVPQEVSDLYKYYDGPELVT